MENIENKPLSQNDSLGFVPAKNVSNAYMLADDDPVLSPEMNIIIKENKLKQFFNIKYINSRLFIWFICIFLMLISGSMYSWSAFECSLVNELGITVDNAINISMWGNLGLCFAFPGGFIYEYFANKFINKYKAVIITSLIAFIINSVGYFIIAFNILGRIYFKYEYIYLSVIYGFIGQGSIFMYITAFKCTIDTFPKEFRGFIVGIIDMSFGVSAAIWSGIANHFDDNISTFFIILGISSAIINIIAIIFIPYFGKQLKSTTEKTVAINNPNNNDSNNMDDNMDTNEVDKFWKLFCKIDFYLISTILFVGSGIGLLFMANIDPMTTAFNFNRLNKVLQILIPISSSIARVSLGILTDIVKSNSKKIIICLSLIMLVLTVYQPFFIAVMQSKTILTIGTLITGFCFGGLMILTPLLVGNLFGTKNMATNWGIIMFMEAIAGIVYSNIQSIIVQISPSNDTCDSNAVNTCSELCFKNGYYLTFISGGIALICCFLLYCRH